MLGCQLFPIVDCLGSRNAMERVIDLGGRKAFCIKGQQFCRRQIFRRKISLPLRVLKTRCADPKFHVAFHRPRFAEQEISSSACKSNGARNNIRGQTRMRIHYGGEFFPPAENQTGTEEVYSVGRNWKQERESMKKMLLSIALAVVAPFAWAQVSGRPPQPRPPLKAAGQSRNTPQGGTIVLKETSWTADVPLRQNGHLCDSEREGP